MIKHNYSWYIIYIVHYKYTFLLTIVTYSRVLYSYYNKYIDSKYYYSTISLLSINNTFFTIIVVYTM